MPDIRANALLAFVDDLRSAMVAIYAGRTMIDAGFDVRQRLGALDKDDLQVLLKHPEWVPMAAWAGLRFSEVLGLEVSRRDGSVIDWTWGEKTVDGRYVANVSVRMREPLKFITVECKIGGA